MSQLFVVYFLNSYDLASTYANSLTNDMTIIHFLWLLHANCVQ